MVGTAFALPECQRWHNVKDVPCSIITSWTPDTGCIVPIEIWNSSPGIVQTGNFSAFVPNCNFTWTIIEVDTYQWNSSIQSGIITLKGEEDEMILVTFGILIIFNLVLVYLPFKVRFSQHESGNYIVGRLIWISSVLFFWFNITMMRQVAVDWGLGIDNFLEVYWWIFTLLTFMCVFIMIYVMLIGTMKLIKEAKLKVRMGDNNYGAGR